MATRTTSKTIGMIPYSLALRQTNPSDKNSEKKVYAVAQRGETVTLAQMAAHIKEHGTPFSEGTIAGIITDFVDEVKEQLLLGNFVLLDGLCKIYYTLSGDGAESAETFDSQMIRRVNIRADVDDEFEAELNQKARFVYVASREEQAQARKREKESIDQEIGSGTGGNSGGGASGWGDPGDITE